ncbi:MAG TPA: class I SAM-dependent methyltransferase [Longimicrobiales bacterium]|nr:class I SAM-dependent methyltransferase [Longimicrobiales bacterium]
MKTAELDRLPLERLAAALVRAAQGGTAVLGADLDGAVAEAVPANGRRLVRIENPADEAAARGGCKSVILAAPLAEHRDLLSPASLGRAWALVRRGGRLLVCAPNPDATDRWQDGDVLDRKTLEERLGAFGRPKPQAEQPYAWLVYLVRRPEADGPVVPRSRRERYDALAELCRGSVIELGSGSGELAATIRDRGHDVVGVELNGPKVQAARLLFPGIEFVEADILEFGGGGRRFDTVVISEVLEHVPPEVGDGMLRVARDLLATGGRLIISVPNEHFIPHKNHIRWFDRRELRKLMRPFGRVRNASDQPFKWLLMYADLAG